jgi:hypothetical protein
MDATSGGAGLTGEFQIHLAGRDRQPDQIGIFQNHERIFTAHFQLYARHVLDRV